MKSFSAKIQIIGINPYVPVPKSLLNKLFEQAGRIKGPIPVRGTLNGIPFKQTVVKYANIWRLYINGFMMKDTGVRVGDTVQIKLEYDPELRVVPMNPILAEALLQNKSAKLAWDKLSPSRQKEILRYLNSIKTGESVERNIKKILKQLLKLG